MATGFIPLSEPRLDTHRTFTDDESPMTTPTYHPAKTAPVNMSSQFTVYPMFHLDAAGYPTRALYYLHKRLLDVAVNPKSRNFVLTTPPLSPVFRPLAVDDEDLEHEDPSALARLSEQKQVLHHLCATIISRDYVRPPTPPIGASPCHTPPRFIPTITSSVEHDEAACRAARLLVQSNSCDVGDLDMLDMLEVELEVELEMRSCVTPKAEESDKVYSWSCPGTIGRSYEDKENYPVWDDRNKRTLLEEMESVVTPCAKLSAGKMPGSEERRKEKQARRRMRNSLNGARGLRV
ncbi:hypothetical protein FRC12_013231 [Ceratobasidium sp. 428]|nr:hypothetical protein FRC12_013231 [Ceratobasidium sp. 428]